MTPLGRFLDRRMIDTARVARRTNITEARMSQMIKSDHFPPCIQEVKLIALAIGVPPAELFENICQDVRLVNPGFQSPFD